MRLLDLRLMAFGTFTDHVLDLSGGSEGLHIVYGGNEAGKSTALNALHCLLFGFPHRTPYDFRHRTNDLRVGGRLRGANGSALDFVRRKGRKDTLLDEDGEPLQDSVLDPFLNGIDADSFRRLSALGHGDLVEGGQDILEGRGDIGESLFAAGLGSGSLHELSKALADEADRLFVGRGQKPEINRALSEFEKARSAVRDAVLKDRDWKELEDRLGETERELTALDVELTDLRQQRTRLHRHQRLIPLISRLRQSRHDLRLLEDTGSPATVAPETLLQAGEEVSQLHQELGGYRKNARELPRRQLEEKEKNGAARQELREIRPDLGLDRAEELRLKARQKTRLRERIKAHQELRNRLENSRRAVEKSEIELRRNGAELDRLPPERDSADLRQAVRRARKPGAIETQRDELRAVMRTDEQGNQRRLARLQGWRGTLDDLLRAQLPAQETVDQWIEQFDLEARAIEQTREQTEKLEQARLDVERDLRELESDQAVPLEDDLSTSREYRDRGWRLVRRAWEGGEDVTAEAEQFDSDRNLADAYEQSVSGSDDVSDRLRREADRVTRRASLIATRERLEREVADLAGRAEEQQTARSERERSWTELWDGSGVVPATPREMKRWLERALDLIARVEQSARSAAELEQLSIRVDEVRNDVGGRLADLGEQRPGSEESLEALLDRADELVDAIQTIETERADLRKGSDRLSASRADQGREFEAATRSLEEWEASWQSDLGDAGLGEDLRPDEADQVLEGLDQLFRFVDEADGLRRRISGMREEMRSFEQRVHDLVERLGPALSDLPADLGPDPAVLWLNDRLSEIEERSRNVESLQKELGSLQEQIAQESLGATLEETLALVEQLDPDLLPAEIEGLDTRVRESEQRRDALIDERGSLRQKLKQMEEGTPATVAAEQAESALARVRQGVQRFLPLRLAQVLLRREIDAYRERHQGPLVKRASELFRRLTLGSFEKLATDYGDDDRPVLVGVRPSDERVGVVQMSDGTRDQLYLALRIASLELHLSRNDVLPFVVDDILINFDDARASASLEILGELSAKTQVILFTHHSRIADLARQSLSDEVLFVSELP